MFSVVALSPLQLSKIDPRRLPGFEISPREGSYRPFRISQVDEALQGAGLPKGAVVELSSPRGLCRATTLALSACAAAQNEARWRAGSKTDGAWCAWIDVSFSLHAGGAARLGVDLERLLVIRPPVDIVPRVASRVVSSRAFAIVVIDLAGVPGASGFGASGFGASGGPVRLDRWITSVRRLAVAAEGSDTTVLLLTDRTAARSMPLPVAMRIELSVPPGLARSALSIRVAKDRAGRVTSPNRIELPLG